MRHPVMVQTAPWAHSPSVCGPWEMTVALPAEAKGTHMSRFIDVFQSHESPLGFGAMREMLSAMLAKLEADAGFIKVALPYFVRKAAPVSGVSSLMDYEVVWEAERRADEERITLTVIVPVTSLCPCSKNISDYGAHNQRSQVTIVADLREDVDAESLIKVAERAASCELWGLLKRA
jgi:GTP cyclohydrolase IB